MELVEGETLDTRLERGALSIPETLGIAIQLSEALDAAHAEGIIHRDIKPGNIRLSKRGQIKILDFGLAKRVVRSDDVVRFMPTVPESCFFLRTTSSRGTTGTQRILRASRRISTSSSSRISAS